MNLSVIRLAGAVAIVLCSAVAVGTPLPVDVTTANVDSIAGLSGATLLASESTAINNLSYNGIARSAVYSTSTGLDFLYQFTNNSTSVNGVERLTGYNFSSISPATVLNVYQTAAAFGIFTAGTDAADSADRTTLGVIGFNFLPGGTSKINPGTTSDTEIIATNATAFGPGNFGLLDGIGDNAKAYQPVASVVSVPEPTTYGLMLLGIGALLFARRRQAVAAV